MQTAAQTSPRSKEALLQTAATTSFRPKEALWQTQTHKRFKRTLFIRTKTQSVLINSVLLNLLCVGISFYNASSNSCFSFLWQTAEQTSPRPKEALWQTAEQTSPRPKEALWHADSNTSVTQAQISSVACRQQHKCHPGPKKLCGMPTAAQTSPRPKEALWQTATQMSPRPPQNPKALWQTAEQTSFRLFRCSPRSGRGVVVGVGWGGEVGRGGGRKETY